MFLLESNAIEVKLNDIAMSIQQSYEVMLAQDCSLDEYRVYSHLTRQGYKVVRHQGDLGEPIPVEILNNSSRKTKRRNNEDIEEVSAVKTQKVVEEVDLDVVGLLEGQSLEKVEEITLESDDDDIEILNDVELYRAKALEMIPNLFQKTEVTLKTPETELLPYRAWPRKKRYKVNVSQVENAKIDIIGTETSNTDSLNISVSETGERQVQYVPNGSLGQNRRYIIFNVYVREIFYNIGTIQF